MKRAIASNKHEKTQHVDMTADEVTKREEESAKNELVRKREAVINDIRKESLARIMALVPDWVSLGKLRFLKSIWATINQAALTQQQDRAMQIYNYSITKIKWTQTATIDQLNSYSADNDPDWPK
ncbi:MAG: hypothetical protein MJA29_04365 [Candidatus Omnitrophica bacterium]|nr:hypothetical protein [Candidatus Omnitrophota bacterium]